MLAVNIKQILVIARDDKDLALEYLCKEDLGWHSNNFYVDCDAISKLCLQS